MQHNLQRFFPLVTLIFVAALAFMCAKLASQVIARSLWTPGVAAVSDGVKRQRAARAEPLNTYSVITKRNLFNSNPKPLGTVKPTTETGETTGDAAPAAPIKLVLIGTAVGEAKDLAVFEKEDKVEIFAIGDEVGPSMKLVEVRSDRAFVKIGGKRAEYLLFTEREIDRKPKKPGARNQRLRQKRPPRATSKKGIVPSSFDPTAVRKVGDNTWVIDRGQVEQSLDNMSQLITEVRVIPNLNADRQADGFKIFEIKPASIFARLGVRNGDIIKEVNGLQLNGIDQAYQALSALQSEASVQINLVRRNKPVTLTYEIR